MTQDAGRAAAPPQTSLTTRLFGNPWLLLALAGLFWSGNHIAGRAGAGHVPPITLASFRWLLGAALMWPFVSHLVRRDWPTIRAGWKSILLLSFFGGAVFSGMQYVALQYTSALNASIFNSFAPAIIAGAGAVMFGDRLGLKNIAGILVSFVGVLVIVSRGSFEVLRSIAFNYGDLLLLLNMAVWAIYSACLRMRPAIHPLSFTFLLALIAGLSLTPLWVWEHVNGFPLQATWRTAAVVGFVTIFPGILAYICWNKGIEAVGSARGGVFLHLIPFYGAVLATTLLGEQLATFHIVGCALILSGVWFAARR
ncbi:MAG TPA: DMT family transporter [Beijerinckiaceae bacterium]|jgi:drug/metabolite transporter (DMT)-like permease